jgi:glucose-6-phosphate isomerase
MLRVDINNIFPFVEETALKSMHDELDRAHRSLEAGDGLGSDFLGWLRLPSQYDREEFQRIKKSAEKIKSDSQVLVVIGIGGSYLGARAAIEFLRSPNYNLLDKDTPDIFFVGNNLSSSAINEIIDLIGNRDFSINVISKSGTTTEPAIAFRIFKKLIEERYDAEEARGRIYATTDSSKGALKNLADTEGYESFVIPDNIGGRYSVLTAVGLLPMAVAGIDIDALMAGAQAAMEAFAQKSFENPVWQYVAARNLLYRNGKTIEILAAYEPSFRFMAEWWKQLYGESEGKDGKGIYPASVDFTADLHSMGQYIQEGMRNLFETVIHIKNAPGSVVIEADEDNIDGLNFLAGKDLNFVNEQAFRGTLLAHVDGGVPNIIIDLNTIDEENFGWIVYFFELACGISGYVLGVNPFNQPGVEAYKKNMFALLGKPGFEEQRDILMERLK